MAQGGHSDSIPFEDDRLRKGHLICRTGVTDTDCIFSLPYFVILIVTLKIYFFWTSEVFWMANGSGRKTVVASALTLKQTPKKHELAFCHKD